jgi:LysM repeat protein
MPPQPARSAPRHPHFRPMKTKRSWIARFLALAGLAAAVIAIVVVASSTDLHSSSDNKGHHSQAQAEQQQKPRTKAKKYVVQSGDTLTAIAHKTGLTLAELQALNPEVDPQTLIAGEVLKLQK